MEGDGGHQTSSTRFAPVTSINLTLARFGGEVVEAGPAEEYESRLAVNTPRAAAAHWKNCS